MNTGIWIVTCMFACVGVTQIVSWMISLKKPRGLRRGYFLLPLYEDPDRLEAQISYVVSQIDWGSLSNGNQIILLVDMGLGEQSRKTCEKMMSTMPGAHLCSKDCLSETLERLDNLQNTR